MNTKILLQILLLLGCLSLVASVYFSTLSAPRIVSPEGVHERGPARAAAGDFGGQDVSSVGQASRLSVIWYSLSLLAILAAMPWPFLSHGRPLFRF